MTDSTEKIFFSYTGEEEPLARAIMHTLQKHFAELPIFNWRSTDHTGEDWLGRLKSELSKSKVVIYLLSPDSVRKQWILFEYGAAWFKTTETLLIPIFHSGLNPEHLTPPLNSINGLFVSDPHFGSNLLNRLRASLSSEMMKAINDESFAQELDSAIKQIQSERHRFDLFISAPMAPSSWKRMHHKPLFLDSWRFAGTGSGDADHYREEINVALRDACERLKGASKKVRYGGMDPHAEHNRTDKVKEGMDALRRSNNFVLVYPAEFATGALCEAGFAHALNIPSTFYVKEGLKVPSFFEATGSIIDHFTSADELRDSLIEKYSNQ